MLTAEPTPPLEVNPEFPVEVEQLILSLLRKQPEDRPDSAREVLNSLRQLPDFDNREASLNRYFQAAAVADLAGDPAQPSGEGGIIFTWPPTCTSSWPTISTHTA